MDSKYINEYEYSNFSQNGEDGIIEFLTNKLVKNKITYPIKNACFTPQTPFNLNN